MMRRVVVVCLATLLSACGAVSNYLAGDDNGTPPAKLEDITAGIKMQQAWDVKVGAVDKDNPVRLTPALCDGKLYAAGGSGGVFAFDAASGKSIWEARSKATLSGGVGCGDELVLVGSEKGQVLAYHAADGKLAWQARVSSEVLAPPRIADGIVVARTIDGKVFGLAAVDGARRWIYDRSTPVLTLRGSGSVAIVHGGVIAGFDNGKLVALTLAEGKPIWEVGVAIPKGRSELERMVDIDSDPQIVGNHVFIATYQGRIASVALDSGSIEWVRDMSSYAGISVDAGNIYLTDDQSKVWALSQSDGSVVWTQDKLSGRSLTAPTALGDHVVVGDFDGYVHWLAKDSGAIVARERVDNSAVMLAPLAGDGLLYVQARGGVLGAYRAQ